ncbi:MAG: ABC transporter ATP-binding protein [Nitrososphaeraceae archaeon]
MQVKNLSKVYYRNDGISSIANADDEYVVLNNLSMDIKDGEFVTIVGPSGCGKSTLLNIIAGIDREYSGGEILFNDLQSDHITSTTYINQDKIIIFQEAALFPWLTVLENVEFGLRVAKVSKDKRNKIAMYYIEMVQLSNFANAYVHQLSGGMKQRVAIARALALNPKILLMDEPFASLDVHTRQMLRLQLLQIHQTTKKTVLFVTHDIKEAVALGDRVILLSPKYANIKREFSINLPHPRQLDHPIVDSITKEILQESKEFEENSEIGLDKIATTATL